jgi:hypothetical protein
MNEDGKFTSVFQNKHIDNNLSPKFPESRILMTALCNGDIDRPLRIEIFDFEKNGKHKSMGVVETSVRSMLNRFFFFFFYYYYLILLMLLLLSL